MKKVIRNLAAITLAGAMMMGTGVTAYAAATTNTNDNSKYTTGVAGDGALTSDTDTINLIKDYDSVNPTGSAAPKSVSPIETFTYDITPYWVWNAGTNPSDTTTPIAKANMPMFGGNVNGTYTITVNADSKGVAFYEGETDEDTNQASDKRVEITVPDYTTVGDYWYKVEERLGNTTGVLYGTNSVKYPTDSTDATDNGGYTRVYYIHVQVTETGENDGEPTLVRSVTMHTSAPETTLSNAQYNATSNTDIYYKANNKVNAIENKYYAGDLVINKTVTGNAGDKNKFFKVKVTFTKPEGTVVNSDIVCNDAYLLGSDGKYTNTTPITISGQYSTSTESNATNRYWTGGTTTVTDAKTVFCEFYVKDYSTVTFSNIPYGIEYEIIEEEPANDTYENKITFASPDGSVTFDGKDLQADTDADSGNRNNNFSKSAKGSISDINDTVTIENYKNNTIDIGVLLSNTPYIALLGVAGAGAAVLARRKRRIEE